jgi:hypothetical protein
MVRCVASIREILRQSGARRHDTFLPINNVETDVLPEHRWRIAGEDAARSGLMFNCFSSGRQSWQLEVLPVR